MKHTILPGAALLAWMAACSSPAQTPGPAAAGGAAGRSGAAGASVGMQPQLGIGGSAGGPNLTPTGGASTSPIGKECARQMFDVDRKPADVLLVLDRSKSMIENTVPPDDATRWDAVVPALTAVITATSASVSWGLKLFPEGEGKSCAATSVTDAIPAPIMPGNAESVNALITQTQALGNGTPTGDAILRATAYLQGRGVGSQYILLATDGDPSCPDDDDDDDAEDYAIAAISAAKAAGFPVYVIGVLDPEEDEGKFPTLNAMAEAGGTALSADGDAPKFYQAQSQAELSAALMQVTGKVVSCEFPFEKRPPNEKNIGVQINGVWIEQDPNKLEGWEYTGDQFMGIQLYGSACERVKDASANKVDIVFGCDEPVR